MSIIDRGAGAMTARELIIALRGASEPQVEEIRQMLKIDETVYRAVSWMKREIESIPVVHTSGYLKVAEPLEVPKVEP